MSAAPNRSGGYPERLPATVSQLIEDLDRAVPRVVVSGPITAGDVQPLNFAAGQRSVVDSLMLLARKEGLIP
jgi:hypothetical protein